MLRNTAVQLREAGDGVLYLCTQEDTTMVKEHPTYHERIVQDPQIMVGKPVVKGTRIPVELVLRHLAQNPDLEELFAAYPRLTVEDVKAVLAYAGAVVEGEEEVPGRRQTKPTGRPAHA